MQLKSTRPTTRTEFGLQLVDHLRAVPSGAPRDRDMTRLADRLQRLVTYREDPDTGNRDLVLDLESVRPDALPGVLKALRDPAVRRMLDDWARSYDGQGIVEVLPPADLSAFLECVAAIAADEGDDVADLLYLRMGAAVLAPRLEHAQASPAAPLRRAALALGQACEGRLCRPFDPHDLPRALHAGQEVPVQLKYREARSMCEQAGLVAHGYEVQPDGRVDAVCYARAPIAWPRKPAARYDFDAFPAKDGAAVYLIPLHLLQRSARRSIGPMLDAAVRDSKLDAQWSSHLASRRFPPRPLPAGGAWIDRANAIFLVKDDKLAVDADLMPLAQREDFHLVLSAYAAERDFNPRSLQFGAAGFLEACVGRPAQELLPDLYTPLLRAVAGAGGAPEGKAPVSAWKRLERIEFGDARGRIDLSRLPQVTEVSVRVTGPAVLRVASHVNVRIDAGSESGADKLLVIERVGAGESGEARHDEALQELHDAVDRIEGAGHACMTSRKDAKARAIADIAFDRDVDEFERASPLQEAMQSQDETARHALMRWSVAGAVARAHRAGRTAQPVDARADPGEVAPEVVAAVRAFDGALHVEENGVSLTGGARLDLRSVDVSMPSLLACAAVRDLQAMALLAYPGIGITQAVLRDPRQAQWLGDLPGSCRVVVDRQLDRIGVSGESPAAVSGSGVGPG